MIILVIFLIVLYVSQFTIGQNNAHTDAKKRMITSKSLYFQKKYITVLLQNLLVKQWMVQTLIVAVPRMFVLA